MKPTCCTRRFLNSHPTLPRTTYGCWAFQEAVPIGHPLDEKREILFTSGKYAEAKKVALAHFQTNIEVLP
jgi:hypothetical protein